MSRFLLVTFLIVLGVVAVSASEPKVIKDPAEYNVYVAALNTADRVQKAAAMESFIVKYPNSVVKLDALEQAMAAYQQVNNLAAVEKTARRVLQIAKGHVRALAVLTFIERAKATQGDQSALAEMQAHAQQGAAALTTWKKPDGLSDAEFTKLRDQMVNIFNGALGFAALQAKDYAKARDAYLKAVQADASGFQDVYQLAIAELEMSPLDPNGFWHIARAINLAESQNLAKVDAYGRAKYKRYHGGEDGWDALVKQAAVSAVPATGFAAQIKAAPTPAEIAVKAVQENDVGSLSFEDMEFVLALRDASPANKDAAETVWRSVQDRFASSKFRVRVKVIAVTATTIEAAITDENQKANKADLHIVMANLLEKPPATGTLITVTGLVTDYTPSPFKWKMINGEI